MTFLLILGYLLILGLEVPPLVAKQQQRELRAFWAALLLSFVFSLAVERRWPIPNPTHLVEALVGPLVKMMGGQ